MKRSFFLWLLLLASAVAARALGPSGDWTCSVSLSGPVSSETGQAPNAYLWIPEGCEQVRFCVLAQQNMTEEAVLRSERFRRRMAELSGALVWVAPWFSQDWAPQTGCQQRFEEMMAGLAERSGHAELAAAPVVPFGHSAQATFPWNFAAWNNERTLAVISFHGDAPRTNLCGYGADNVEWGRKRNIDGIPGLMIVGEYEWWEARVRPALAFQMMYPEACLSFLCDTGAGHFDCPDETLEYMALFIKKAVEQRLNADHTLRKVERSQGWLASRFVPDLPQSDGPDKGTRVGGSWHPTATPFASYGADPHDAFWYFDEEMALLTEARYRATLGKQPTTVAIRYDGRLVPYDERQQGSIRLDFRHLSAGDRFTLEAVGRADSLHIDYISGPVRKLSDTTFEILPYDGGADNAKRSHHIWLAAVAEGDASTKRAVQPIHIVIK